MTKAFSGINCLVGPSVVTRRQYTAGCGECRSPVAFDHDCLRQAASAINTRPRDVHKVRARLQFDAMRAVRVDLDVGDRRCAIGLEDVDRTGGVRLGWRRWSRHAFCATGVSGPIVTRPSSAPVCARWPGVDPQAARSSALNRLTTPIKRIPTLPPGFAPASHRGCDARRRS